MEVVVGRGGRPHGVRGTVSVQVRTDVPEQRFVPGAVFGTDPPDSTGRGPLVLTGSRDNNGVLLLDFQGVADRTAAERLRGVLLLADVPALDDDPEVWSVPALVGLRAQREDGREAGVVIGVEHGPAQDLLVVRQPSGAVARVPFVQALVPVVDVAGGRVVLAPPGGLLEGDGEPEDAR